MEQDLVQIRICADETKSRCFLIQDDLVCVRSKLYPASKEFFEFGRLARASMDETDSDRVQTVVRCSPAEADEPCYKALHLLPIGMSGNASVAQGDREIGGFEAF